MYVHPITSQLCVYIITYIRFLSLSPLSFHDTIAVAIHSAHPISLINLLKATCFVFDSLLPVDTSLPIYIYMCVCVCVCMYIYN